MAIAQICLQCGQGLGAIRPHREPHYGLPVVQCPRCDWTTVRRRPPAAEAWKTVQRRVWLFVIIGGKLFVTLLMLLFMVSAIGSMYDGEFELAHASASKPTGYWLGIVLLLVVLPVLVGAWLTFAFSYLDLRKVFSSWAGIVATNLLLIAIGLGIAGVVDGISPLDTETKSIIVLAGMGVGNMMPICLGLLAVMMLFALAGIPIGQVALAALRVTRGWHFRWLLKRRRLRRSME